MTLGFACRWDRRPEQTWSGTPWNLLQALGRQTEVLDLGPRLAMPVRQALRVGHLRWRGGRLRSNWSYAASTQALTERLLQQNLARAPEVDAVIEIHDLSPISCPHWMVQDLTYDVLLELDPDVTGLQFALDSRRLRHLKERQRGLLDAATGVFVMSEWLARQLRSSSQLPGERIRVIAPGATAKPSSARQSNRAPDGRRILFVGRDFERKGGDLLVEAFEIVHRQHPGTELTICGPTRWPLPGPIPTGVRFVGSQPHPVVEELFATHDLFVLPSRFEAFGIVFLEAFSHGLPCIGRNDFAMPELITPGVDGDLVISDDPVELATKIVALLDDESIREHVWKRGPAYAELHSWDATAAAILDVVSTAAQSNG